MYEHCAVPRIWVEHSATAEVPAAQEAWTYAEVSHKISGFGKGLGAALPVFAGEPGPDATTEQGQGNHGERERR